MSLIGTDLSSVDMGDTGLECRYTEISGRLARVAQTARTVTTHQHSARNHWAKGQSDSPPCERGDLVAVIELEADRDGHLCC